MAPVISSAREERSAMEGPISASGSAASRWVAMTYVLPLTSKRGVSRAMIQETVSTGCNGATTLQVLQKVGLEVDDQLVFRFQAMDPKS